MPDIIIAFFALGLLAGLLKSDLKVPQSVYQTLTILLMLVLGLEGGVALHGKFDFSMLPSLAGVAVAGFLIPLLCYPILRRAIGLNPANAASIAAHYGSVSAGTFAVALTMAKAGGLTLKPETTLYLVMLELPAIISAICLYNKLSGSTQGQGSGTILREALTSSSVLLLGGGVVIGYLYGPLGLGPLEPVLLNGYKSMLALFLLEMGLCTAKACSPLPWQHARLMLFAAVAPFALAGLGIAIAIALNLPAGSAFVLTCLIASASYIAAPAAIQTAIPQADIGLAMLAALGITFPINIFIGLPMYMQWVQHFIH